MDHKLCTREAVVLRTALPLSLLRSPSTIRGAWQALFQCCASRPQARALSVVLSMVNLVTTMSSLRLAGTTLSVVTFASHSAHKSLCVALLLIPAIVVHHSHFCRDSFSVVTLLASHSANCQSSCERQYLSKWSQWNNWQQQKEFQGMSVSTALARICEYLTSLLRA